MVMVMMVMVIVMGVVIVMLATMLVVGKREGADDLAADFFALNSFIAYTTLGECVCVCMFAWICVCARAYT